MIYTRKVILHITPLCSLLHILLKDGGCVCRTSEDCKSLVLQDKCNIEIFLSPAYWSLVVGWGDIIKIFIYCILHFSLSKLIKMIDFQMERRPNMGLIFTLFFLYMLPYNMSQCMRFLTMWYVRPAKLQISLCIRAV